MNSSRIPGTNRTANKIDDGSTVNRNGLSLIEIVVVIGVIALLTSISLPAVCQMREKARDLHFRNNIRQVAMAMHQLCSTFGKLPDNSQLPWTLPVVDEAFGFKRERTDDALRSETAVFRCPSDVISEVDGFATGNVASNGELSSKGLENITDGTTNTLLLAEMCSGLGVAWSSGPLLFVAGINSSHPQSVNCSFADGSIRGLSKSIDEGVLRSLLTIDGGEIIVDF